MSSDDVKLTLAKSDAVYNLKLKGSPSVTRTLLACPVSKGTTISEGPANLPQKKLFVWFYFNPESAEIKYHQ